MLYMGKDIQERMNLFGLTVKEVADKTFLDEDVLIAIINNEIPLENIEEFDFSLLCGALHCQEDFFTNPEARVRDLVSASMNRGLDNEKSMNVKAKIQDFMNDYVFISEVLSENA